MLDSVTRLNAALSGRYRIERQLGEGGMATVLSVSLSVLLVGACGGDKEPAGPSGPTQPVVATIEVSPSEQTLASVGVDQQFSAVAKDASGTPISGQSFAWSSSNVGVATVDASSGLVKTIGNGTTTITATAGPVSGSASITVEQMVASVSIGPNAGVMIPPGQTAQLTAEALDLGGTRVEDKSITWESSDGQIVEVSPTGVVTGIAYGAANVFATTDGVVGSRLIAVSDPVPIETCKIEGIKQEAFVHRPEKYFRPVGVVRSLVLFVDFPDFPGTDSTELVFDEIWTLAEEWFSEASNGRMVNTAESTPNWIRLPHPMEYYEVRTHWEWVIDAIHAADASVDFTQFDLVHIVVPKNSLANATNSFTSSYAEQSGAGVSVDGVEVRHGATDVDSYNILVHEIGHLFGLPDLGGANPEDFWENMSPVGAWDPMSLPFVTPLAHFLVWHKWKIGWVLDEDVDCITFGEFERTAFTFEQPDEFQAIVIPTSETTAYVIEARKRIGFDARICQEGVLVYSVDGNVESGDVPIWIQQAQPDIVNHCEPANRVARTSARDIVCVSVRNRSTHEPVSNR